MRQGRRLFEEMQETTLSETPTKKGPDTIVSWKGMPMEWGSEPRPAVKPVFKTFEEAELAMTIESDKEGPTLQHCFGKISRVLKPMLPVLSGKG